MSDDIREQAREFKRRWDDGSITPVERERLQELVVADEALADELVDDLMVDRLLRQAGGGADDEAFVQEVAARIDAQRTATDRSGSRPGHPHRRRPTPRATPSRNRRWPGVLAACTVVLLGVAGLWLALAETTTSVVSVTGTATIDGVLAHQGMVVPTGAEVAVDTGASVALRLAAGGSVRADRAAAVRFESSTTLRCTTGRLDCLIDHRAGAVPFEIVTPHGWVRVVGTRFTVEVGASTVVSVEEGVVAVRESIAEDWRRVAAGERAVLGQVAALADLPGLLVHYDFSAGAGSVVHDRAGRSPALDLTITDGDAVRWLPGGGLELVAPTLLTSQQPAQTVIAACRTSDAVTILAEVRPAPPMDADDPLSFPRRIVGISGSTKRRDLTLGQGLYHGDPALIEVRVRTDLSDENGRPSIASTEGVVIDRRQVIIFTRDADGRCRLYFDGRPVAIRQVLAYDLPPVAWGSSAASEQTLPGSLDDWAADMPLLLGAELDATGEPKRPWQGILYRVAIWDRALEPAEVALLQRPGGSHATGHDVDGE